MEVTAEASFCARPLARASLVLKKLCVFPLFFSSSFLFYDAIWCWFIYLRPRRAWLLNPLYPDERTVLSTLWQQKTDALHQ